MIRIAAPGISSCAWIHIPLLPILTLLGGVAQDLGDLGPEIDPLVQRSLNEIRIHYFGVIKTRHRAKMSG